MAADNKNPEATAKGNQNGLDEREIKKESAKAAQKAREAQKQAHKLKQAAYGAGDPEERQKLMEQAIDKEIEAESLGKTAKYMRTGTFQGMAVGAGIGVVPGLTLGTLTGTLVGGLVSTITGGIGGAAGAVTGWLHGPFWNLGEVAGKGIRKITGDLPGWKATKEQKWTLEKMLGQAKEQDMPTEEELEHMQKDDGSKDWGEYVENAAAWRPGVPAWMQGHDGGEEQQQTKQPNKKSPSTTARETRPAQPAARTANEQAADDLARHLADEQKQSKRNQPTTTRKTSTANAPTSQLEPDRKKPRKLEVRSENQPAREIAPERKQPRKLERRG